ncbi:uncharacterized protein LOC142178409 [Nicotiana tabacum]|uniref:Uncharacterized protein LOC142178409 n=1 Tax=Nicotiana tabacum TaxID=4097 RepID=A0AC58U2Y7_TOBAC
MVYEGHWDEEKIREIFPDDLATYILENMKPRVLSDVLDKPVWMLESRGVFCVKSTWKYLRRRHELCNAYRKIWVKGLPFKIAFFMWKVWKNKLPLDDFFRRLGYLIASKCWCSYNASFAICDSVRIVEEEKEQLQEARYSDISHKRPDIQNMIEKHTSTLKYSKVLWEFPNQGWIKVNTDGTSMGNPGRSSIGFVLRNEEGDIVHYDDTVFC